MDHNSTNESSPCDKPEQEEEEDVKNKPQLLALQDGNNTNDGEDKEGCEY
jgi:hypothetical protein